MKPQESPALVSSYINGWILLHASQTPSACAIEQSARDCGPAHGDCHRSGCPLARYPPTAQAKSEEVRQQAKGLIHQPARPRPDSTVSRTPKPSMKKSYGVFPAVMWRRKPPTGVPCAGTSSPTNPMICSAAGHPAYLLSRQPMAHRAVLIQHRLRAHPDTIAVGQRCKASSGSHQPMAVGPNPRILIAWILIASRYLLPSTL